MIEQPTVTVDLERARCNIAQAMVICGVSRRTVYNWLQSGRLEYVRTPGGSVRIYVDSLLRSRA